MGYKFGLLATLATLVATTVSGEHVVSLTDTDFDAHIAQNKYVLAEFFAPWCGHCKALAPEYEAAAEALSSQDVEGGLSLVAVDATESKELASRFGVQGFPTLKWIVNGEESDYTGGRKKDDIVAWVNKKTGPPAEAISNKEELDAFKEKAEVVVVGWFESRESDAAKAFIGAAETDSDTLFAISTEDEVKSALEVAGDAVVVFRKFEAPDEPRVDCEGEITRENVRKCVAGSQLPLVIPFSQSTAPKIFGGAIKQHVLVFVESAEDSVLSEVRNVATEYQGEYLFVSVAKTEGRILEFFGVTEGDIPTARIVVMGDAMVKFKIPGSGLSESQLKDFVAEHKEGKLSPDLKSEDPADDDKTGNVWILKGKSHDEVAFDSSKNVFVKFYAPWCGHCKKMAPDFEKLGEHFKDDEEVIIAKFDATANEVASIAVQGFPTLKFFPKGVDSVEGVVDFDGSRDLEGMKKFIEDNRK